LKKKNKKYQTNNPSPHTHMNFRAHIRIV